MEQKQYQEPPSVVDEIHACIHRNRHMQTTGYFRPSSIGNCRRQSAYQFLKYPKEPERFDARMQLILDNGSAIHEILQKRLAESQNYFMCPEVHVYVPEIDVFGHVDGVLIDRKTDYKTMLEFKSINDKEYTRITKPKSEHIWQANLYCGLLGLKWFNIIYWNKNNQHLREFKIPFDKNLYQQAMTWCREVRVFIDAGALPPYVEKECNEMFCQFVARCRKTRPKSMMEMSRVS